MTTKHSFPDAHLFTVLTLAAWTVVIGYGESVRPSRSTTAASADEAAAEEILAKLRSTYVNAKSYSDNAVIVERSVSRSQGTMSEFPYTRLAVLFARPNRYAISFEHKFTSANGGDRYRIVCDGKRVRASVNELPDQIHEAIAPREATVDNLIPEPELRAAMLQVSLSDLFPQLVMLLSQDSEKPVFPRATSVRLLPEEKIDGTECYRISLDEPEGNRVLWIDKAKMVLKRMSLPISNDLAAIDPMKQLVSVSVDMDFENITLDAEIPDSAVTLDVPEGGRLVRRFVPPPPSGPSDQLGRLVKEYQFTDISGEPVTPASLAGKIAVFDFWATDCPPCKEGTPVLEEAYQQLKGESDVAFFGVSTDPKGLPNAQVEKTLRAWGASFPLLRDLDKNAFYALNVQATPTLMVISPDNRLQVAHLGPLENANDLVKKVRHLREHGDLRELAKQEHAEQLEEHAAILAAATLKTSLADDVFEPSEPGERRLPNRFKVEELWHSKLAHVGEAGDVAAISDADGTLQEVLVLDAGKAVVRYDAAGKQLGRVQLPEHAETKGGFIRTAVDAEGSVWCLVSGTGWQQVFVYDKNWNPVLTFPDEPHSGVGDARLVDFKENGVPIVVVGYRGGHGVQAGSLVGQLQWTNHYLDHVLQVANHPVPKSPDQTLWCTSTRGTVLEIDSAGKSGPEIVVPGHTLVNVYPSVEDGEANFGLSLTRPAQYELVAFDDQGKVEWHKALPIGDYPERAPSIQRIVLIGDKEYMIVAAPNGSLTFVSTDGDLFDSFDYGKAISGLAVVPSDEGTILLVSAGNRLTAWRITADSAP